MEKSAANLPSPVEKLEQETQQDEAELTKLKEQSLTEPDTEELAEESLPSEDTEDSTEQPDEEVQEEETDVEEQKSEDDSQSDDDLPKSKRAQERYRKLASENKQLKEDNQNLYSVVNSLRDQGYTKQEAEQIAPQMDYNNIDPQQYEQDVARKAQSIVSQELSNRELQQARLTQAEKFQDDLQVIEEKYEVLDESHESYDEDLSNFVSEVYESRATKDPKVRLTSVVDEVMKLREKAASEVARKTVGKVAKQASNQAISPSGGRTDTQSLTDKIKAVDSEAELEEMRKQLPVE